MRFKLFQAVVVLGKGTDGKFAKIGGTDNLEDQVNRWLEKNPFIEITNSQMSAHLMTGQDGSVAKEYNLMAWYEDKDGHKVDRQQTVSGQKVKPLRFVEVGPSKEK